ncbi:AzlD domain-containing protein [Proteus faecis]|uniref:AzlD domain-containing protein n=1 Tax=Proteus faecis TaxID=2050967 RepID=A0AAW7CUJ3_9GAMM|nr:AzlD domain-containing protein [Proteus faecis]MBG3012594.1 AzlD domain-containing protein [Proteus mirabilis]MDL5166777.1 AzlD domain-containing protein [Proteus faecis]MDL5274588.1 AzlD domain-containing protein [Proteus faecis]MDL5278330.1 AzlD domain-containing protein [Proteus faecis]MDL5307332.1 AzlD domain-containing protein [Proteus faecis]
MMSTASIITGIIILAVGTYTMRLSGILLNNKAEVSERVKEILSLSAIVILFSVAMTSTFFDGGQLADISKIIGVGVAGVLTWQKKPFIIIVLSAAIVTAGLRWLINLWV